MTKFIKVLALLLFLVPFTAWAHGDAQWIMEDPEISYCCGPDDCQIVYLTFGPAGYEFHFSFKNKEGVIVFEKYFVIPHDDKRVKFTQNPKSEGKAWACVQMNPYAWNYGELICLIVNMGV